MEQIEEHYMIRRITAKDQTAIENMDTGLESDYIKMVFPWIVKEDVLYGAFIGETLVGLIGYHVFEGKFVVLGRLRVAVPYRKQGLAQFLMAKAFNEVKTNKDYRWVGLATQENNLAVHHIARHLNMSHVARFHACQLHEEGKKALEAWCRNEYEAQPKKAWTRLRRPEDKRALLQSLEGQATSLGMFPYQCYYPLPYDQELFSDAYLDQCEAWVSGEECILFNADTKGVDYLHLKYFGERLFEQPDIWSIVLDHAEKYNQTIWIDVNQTHYDLMPKEWFTVDEPWHLYGQYLKTEPHLTP
ncbi:GNAT family N-acetyltransferase [Caldalkalibacillus salinus]|uniref:GNAT family N-acetyltransferase n=1 Tax=Caldalkalibacillus salinus TaxID=2803787 RepID=UPI00192361BE|nr:GNAT family N-acetyltransferase [Caldalkalibacillus salinus]